MLDECTFGARVVCWVMRRLTLAAAVLVLGWYSGCDLYLGPLGEEEVLLRFGAVADVQYCDCPYDADLQRDYRASLPKLGEAVDMLNAAHARGDIAFSIHLGDLIDRDSASFGPVLAQWGALDHPAILVPGNHEISAFGDYQRTVEVLGIENRTGRGYFRFEAERAPGWRFLVLDGNDASLTAGAATPEYDRGQLLFDTARSRDSRTVWWSGGVSAAQLAWLEQELEASRAASERVVIFSHFPLGGTEGFDLWNADDVLALLARYDHVAGFFGGHYHLPYTVSGAAVPQIGVPSLLGEADGGEWGIATVYADGHIGWQGQRQRLDAWKERPSPRQLWQWTLALAGAFTAH